MYRTGWGSKQNSLFDKVIKVLSTLRLARLAFEQVMWEYISRVEIIFIDYLNCFSFFKLRHFAGCCKALFVVNIKLKQFIFLIGNRDKKNFK